MKKTIKPKKTRYDIRIVGVDKTLFMLLKDKADSEKRTMSKQAQIILEQYFSR